MARARGDGAAGGEKQPSQMAMVRISLGEMGGDPKPHELQEHIKAKFGREIPANIISNYKSQLKRKGAVGANGTARRGRKPGGGNGGLRFEDLEVVRGLVTRLG